MTLIYMSKNHMNEIWTELSLRAVSRGLPPASFFDWLIV